MNKIYQAFDSVKLNNQVKVNTREIVRERMTNKNRFSTKKWTLGVVSVACLSLIVFFFTNNTPAKDIPNDNQTINTLNVIESVNDSFLYNGDIYALSSSYNVSDFTRKEYLGILHQVTDNNGLVNNFDSLYHDGYNVYTTDNKNILIIMSDNESLVYER